MARPAFRRAFLVTELGELHPWLKSVADDLRLDRRTSYGVQVALEEVVANIATHGLAPDDKRPIIIDIAETPDAVTIEVLDEGPGFDPTQAAAPDRPNDLDSAVIGGLGLVLTRHYTSAMTYRRHQGRNALTLRFNRSD